MHILTRVEEDQAYSNLLLNQTIAKHTLKREDISLLTELVYGTIQRLNTIDFFLEDFVQSGLKKLDVLVKNLLRLSFYQLYYLEKIPPHAVVNEAVNIAKQYGHRGISGMVNGILRSVLRQKDQLAIPADLPAAKRIALEFSHPEWLVEHWIGQYGERKAERICRANNETPHVSIRVNTRRLSREQELAKLVHEGIMAEASPLAQEGIIVRHAGNMALTAAYEQGDYSIQDESSMLVAHAVAPEAGMRVLDCCAAPGGKTMHMAELMNDQGELWACDVHEHKEKLLKDQAKRLHLDSIRTKAVDARELHKQFPPESFERILVDAPCSGLGVIRRKPDVKWRKTADELAAITDVQHDILDAVSGLLAPGGILVYSTCTLSYEENQGMVQTFLQEHADYQLAEFTGDFPLKQDSPKGMVEILPDEYHSDGFFIARMQKKRA
ncbi:MAG: 16S rRNA (cytosine(967)-C(5))-methyltransferase [Paenibacillus sp. RIFOXYA1_FULL_44_5]|nr:MAG: 16S rRNA (cytosine(967)-C(5))-methyltransferase [Paenibacillus sp. RIFOXYA1_FULL_44_5]